MSFVPNVQNQISFQSTEYLLTDREKSMLQNSWAKYFSDFVFPRIDEAPFAVLYSTKDSQPNTPVNVQVGALILKELHGLSDDGVFTALLFDLRFRVALHTKDFDEQSMSDRTLGRFRERCRKYEEETGIDLIGDAVRRLSRETAKLMHLDASLKRMDSMMISSNIKNMSRLELLYVTLSNAVRAILKKAGQIENGLNDYANDANASVVCKIYWRLYKDRGSMGSRQKSPGRCSMQATVHDPKRSIVSIKVRHNHSDGVMNYNPKRASGDSGARFLLFHSARTAPRPAYHEKSPSDRRALVR